MPARSDARIYGIAFLNLGKALFHCLGRGTPIYMRHSSRALIRFARVFRSHENIVREERLRMDIYDADSSVITHLLDTPLHLMVITFARDSWLATQEKENVKKRAITRRKGNYALHNSNP